MSGRPERAPEQTAPAVELTTAARPFYLTTAIDYANGMPHLGHALEKIQADCVARYRRVGGRPVHFVTGLDEHGQTVARTADEAGSTPQAWVDNIAERYREALAALSISFDDFIRTTEPRHARAVRELLRRIRRLEPGDVYVGRCSGFYCGGCETFKSSAELVAGGCAEHPTVDVESVDERAHFFRLSAYAERLRAHYEAHPHFVLPPGRFEEIKVLVAGELRDVPISRSTPPWGIPFPGAPRHTVHVWFDALVNYLSATGFPDKRCEQLWPADLQLVGPDITRFHAVLWPAMLMAAGLEPPRQIWAHGWLKADGARFSKLAGVGVTLEDAIARHGADVLRYYLLESMPWEGDGQFSWERLDAVATRLADTLGTLVSRAVALAAGHRRGRIPPAHAQGELDRAHRAVLDRYRSAMDALHLGEGALQLELLESATRRYLDERSRARTNGDEAAADLDETVASVHRALVRIAALAQPFMPSAADSLYRTLGGRGSVAELGWAELVHPRTAGWQVTAGEPLFAKGSRADA